jgi:hypothetical protein
VVVVVADLHSGELLGYECGRVLGVVVEVVGSPKAELALHSDPAFQALEAAEVLVEVCCSVGKVAFGLVSALVERRRVVP